MFTLHPQGHPFSLSYGVNLPSSLTRVLSSTFSDFGAPTCVGLRYGRHLLWLEAFLGSLGSAQLPLEYSAGSLSPLDHCRHGFAYGDSLPASTRHLQRRAEPTFLRPPFARNEQVSVREY